MTTTPLNVTVSTQLDAGGNGLVSAGPLSAREVWHPASAHISVLTDVREAVCNIYVGDAPQQRCFRDATASGSMGDSTDRISSDTVVCGSKVWAVWTGGDPLTTATLTITGTRDI